MSYRGIPNILTIMRMLMSLPIMYFIFKQHIIIALYIFILAGLSDAVDGFIARRYNCMSYLGAILDPIADKILMTVIFFSLAYLHIIDVYLAIIVIFRDFFIISGVLLQKFFIGHISIKPTFLSKLNTVLQLVFIFLVLVTASNIIYLPTLILILKYLVVITTISSFFSYLFIGINSLNYVVY